MKTCRTCGTSKPPSDFYPKRRKGKPPTLTSDCRDCSKMRNKNFRDTFKKLCLAFIGQFACSTCGYSACLGALEFHHLDPTKKDFVISKRRSKALTPQDEEELRKCVVLCVNCHRQEHNRLAALKKSAPAAAGDKVCPKCNLLRWKDDFYANHGICKFCFIELTTFKQRKRKEQCVVYKGSHCIKCNVSDNYLLDFHHLDRAAKEINISPLLGRAFDKIKLELDKCVLLCGRCHREVHYFNEEIEDTFKATSETFRRIEEIEEEIYLYKTTIGPLQKSQLLAKLRKVIKTCQECSKEIYKSSTLCVGCAGKQQRRFQVTREDLEDLITHSPSMEECGRLLGVNSNSMRKRCRSFDIDYKRLLGTKLT